MAKNLTSDKFPHQKNKKVNICFVVKRMTSEDFKHWYVVGSPETIISLPHANLMENKDEKLIVTFTSKNKQIFKKDYYLLWEEAV